MYYSVFEKHTGGTWWYHSRSFHCKRKALKDFKARFWYDPDRTFVIKRHKQKLLEETLYTTDFQHFYAPGGEIILITDKPI